MEALEVQRIRGTNDLVPPEDAQLRALGSALRNHFELYGYRGADTPVLETLDLFLRKSGEEIAARMYTFTHWNRTLCLRPEFTASLMRAYVNHLQDRPLPVRLHYAGATFRYEKPQRGRYRQFTEVGLECIGGQGPSADAEVLASACGALDAVGLRHYRVVVGHLGVVLELLRQLGIDEHGQALILANMETLTRRRADPTAVLTRMLSQMGVNPDLNDDAPDLDASIDNSSSPLPSLLAEFGSAGAARVAEDLLSRADLALEGGSRTPNEIVARLLAKAGRNDPTEQVRQATDFMIRLRALAGRPDEAFTRLEGLLAEYHLDCAPLREVERALTLFESYVAGTTDLTVDLSLGRGLRYYTGLVFEIYHDGANRIAESNVGRSTNGARPDGGTAMAGAGISQICGGGRYDDLVRAVGGRQSVPACGFSFGLERVALALQAEGAQGFPARPVDVLVVPVTDADEPEAIGLAQQLRAAELSVEYDVRLRGVKSALRHADRQTIPFVVICGERERSESRAIVRNMRSRTEHQVERADLIALLRGGP